MPSEGPTGDLSCAGVRVWMVRTASFTEVETGGVRVKDQVVSTVRLAG